MTTNKLPKRLEKTPEEVIAEQQNNLRGSEFIVLLETEGSCQVGSIEPDRRKHCRRLDTVVACVYVGDGTREGSLVPVGRTCMKHLPEIVATVKRELPGGNGAQFKEPHA